MGRINTTPVFWNIRKLEEPFNDNIDMELN